MFFTEIIVQPVQLGGIVVVFFLPTDHNHCIYFTVFMCAVEKREGKMEAKQVFAVLGGKWQTPKTGKNTQGGGGYREREA